MKNVILDRRHGDFLIRVGGEFKSTGLKNKNFISVGMSERQAGVFERFGEDVSEVKQISELFASLDVTKIKTIPDDANKDKTTTNRNAITVEKVKDGQYTIKGDFSKLEAYTSTDAGQSVRGDLKWVGLLVSTGEDTIKGLKYNKYTLGDKDIEEATSVGGSNGSFVLWLPVEGGNVGFMITKDKESCVINIKFEDTPAN